MLDLSKLKALSIPEKEIEVEILGEPQKLKITAFGDDVSVRMADIRENKPDECEINLRKILLVSCAGLSPDDADLLLQRDGIAASKILSEIFTLSKEFDSERKKIREQAEKNSGKGAAENTPN